MWEQEKIHLATFEQLLTMYRVRPTVFLPLWDILGYSLGYATATMGKESAMACTVAVEESITEHYNDQIRELLIRDPEERDNLFFEWHVRKPPSDHLRETFTNVRGKESTWSM